MQKMDTHTTKTIHLKDIEHVKLVFLSCVILLFWAISANDSIVSY